MGTQRLARSVAQQSTNPTTMRTATVVDVLAPIIGENDVAVGWQVQLDFGGGEVRRATVASSYRPIPRDVVAVFTYLNTLFVVDKMTGGDSGLEPGGRVAYGYIPDALVGQYTAAPVSTEVELHTSLTKTFTARTGAAYEVKLYTGYRNTVANQWAFFRLRQTVFNGADIGEWFRRPTTIAGEVCGFEGTMLIRNDTGVDFDATVVPTLTSPAGGIASAFCTLKARAYIEITVAGSSKLYPHAAPLIAPPDVT